MLSMYIGGWPDFTYRPCLFHCMLALLPKQSDGARDLDPRQEGRIPRGTPDAHLGARLRGACMPCQLNGSVVQLGNARWYDRTLYKKLTGKKSRDPLCPPPPRTLVDQSLPGR
eukprot:scaffold148_cov341-Pavlova_lutheri.AAC.15